MPSEPSLGTVQWTEKKVCWSCEQGRHWAQSLTQIQNRKDFYLPWIFNSPESQPSAYHNAPMHVCGFSPLSFKRKQTILFFLWCLESCLNEHWSLWSHECVYFKTKSARLLPSIWWGGAQRGHRTMEGNQVGFNWLVFFFFFWWPVSLFIDILKANFCSCLFIFSFTWIEKDFHWSATYWVLRYPAHPVALYKPTAVWGLIMHARLPSPEAKGASADHTFSLVSVFIMIGADLYFWTHFAA